jgi:hypothetical protein
MKKRGRVQLYTNVGDGIIAVDGVQYAFQLQGMWRSEMPPRIGMLVEVTFDAQGTPESIVEVPDSQIAKEQAEQALASAKQHGTALAGTVRSRFAIPVLAAEVILLIGFFVLPNVTIGFVNRSLTGWDLIGLDVNTLSTNAHGFLSLLCLLCLFAPLAVPFLKQWWSRWLYVAPLGFTVLALITVYFQIQNAGHAARESASDLFGSAAAREMTNQVAGMFHIGMGVFVVVICALYLASRSLKSTMSPK